MSVAFSDAVLLGVGGLRVSEIVDDGVGGDGLALSVSMLLLVCEWDWVNDELWLAVGEDVHERLSLDERMGLLEVPSVDFVEVGVGRFPPSVDESVRVVAEWLMVPCVRVGVGVGGSVGVLVRSAVVENDVLAPPVSDWLTDMESLGPVTVSMEDRLHVAVLRGRLVVGDALVDWERLGESSEDTVSD